MSVTSGHLKIPEKVNHQQLPEKHLTFVGEVHRTSTYVYFLDLNRASDEQDPHNPTYEFLSLATMVL
jgi:hypothetical protein